MFIDGWFVPTKSPPPGTKPGGGHRQEAENLLPQEYMTRGERVFQCQNEISFLLCIDLLGHYSGQIVILHRPVYKST